MLVSNDELATSPYLAYSYSYPHKTAYRQFDKPKLVKDLWRHEKKDSLFLYMHVPFCEMRCGFCNLFTVANPAKVVEAQLIHALELEAKVVADSVGDANYTQMAIGGGTPTFLSLRDLHALFDIAREQLGVNLEQIPISVETSPQTATREKIQLLYQNGTTRVSIGVQSFIEDEALAAGRPQSTKSVEAALEVIRSFSFNTLNIDLIYGLPGQTVHSFLHSLQCALKYEPEEIYLYPLYVRPLTGLSRGDSQWRDARVEIYREARQFLLSNGYEQVSMRMFRRKEENDLFSVVTSGSETSGPLYCCQSDGMVGIGPGARSYTSSVHYSSRYAVQRESIKQIISEYNNRGESEFRRASYGIELLEDDRRRRFVIQSLLQVTGLSRKAYAKAFDADCLQHFQELSNFQAQQLVEIDDEFVRLTEHGIERSDELGVRLYSPQVVQLMESYQNI